jgi:hypothetical protein
MDRDSLVAVLRARVAEIGAVQKRVQVGRPGSLYIAWRCNRITFLQPFFRPEVTPCPDPRKPALQRPNNPVEPK